uniref:Sulfatase-modifying factor enzyme 1 n=1 Tax=Candidatus Kentrum sp. TUN TaxID=2126343 RepID=A0A451AUF7_9GAMM|nr:MAG: Sulfatase-modifying factor enzyme 1 [Candidatus Kentron sp. TUN]VFK69686.1 MAG: Sulfatase-modifying factor enzyme 1 [Candidatus Kentron sp. TUN]
MSESESFVSVRLLKPLVKKLTALSGKFSDSPDKRAEEIRKIGNIFGQPLDLARHYIVPHCRYDNPLDHFEAQQSVTSTRSPVFSAIDIFLKGNFPLVKEGNRHLFVLSDAGMGKTSLLMMIKLTHLMAFWPPEYDCLLLKIGEDTLDTIAAHPNKAHTILLLDALDEDPLAWSNIKERLLKILAVTDSYYRVIISCRTQFFPKVDADLFGRSGQVRIGRHSCAMIFLTLFDNAQVSHYLAKRFPDYLHIFRNPKRWRVEQLVLGMRSLRFCPLLLSHAHDILEVSGSETGQWNAYTLYEALIGNWLSREEDALRKFADPPDRKDLRAICTAIAVYLQQEGRRTLSRHALGDLVARFPVARHLEHFDVRECSFLNCNAQGDLRFSYYSIQEFLVAHAMMNKSVVPDIVGDPARPTASAESISVDKPIRATDQLLVFLKDASDGLLDFSLLGQLDLGDQSYPLISQLHFYDRLADGSRGPMMQLILAGEFLMGSPQGIGREREHPQHRVRIATPFALGTYPVTFAEYDYFCEARGREKRFFRF